VCGTRGGADTRVDRLLQKIVITIEAATGSVLLASFITGVVISAAHHRYRIRGSNSIPMMLTLFFINIVCVGLDNKMAYKVNTKHFIGIGVCVVEFSDLL
jgi:ABC-type spermidine/putrescine transport system permease subunit II